MKTYFYTLLLALTPFYFSIFAQPLIEVEIDEYRKLSFTVPQDMKIQYAGTSIQGESKDWRFSIMVEDEMYILDTAEEQVEALGKTMKGEKDKIQAYTIGENITGALLKGINQDNQAFFIFTGIELGRAYRYTVLAVSKNKMAGETVLNFLNSVDVTTL